MPLARPAPPLHAGAALMHDARCAACYAPSGVNPETGRRECKDCVRWATSRKGRPLYPVYKDARGRCREVSWLRCGAGRAGAGMLLEDRGASPPPNAAPADLAPPLWCNQPLCSARAARMRPVGPAATRMAHVRTAALRMAGAWRTGAAPTRELSPALRPACLPESAFSSRICPAASALLRRPLLHRTAGSPCPPITPRLQALPQHRRVPDSPLPAQRRQVCCR